MSDRRVQIKWSWAFLSGAQWNPKHNPTLLWCLLRDLLPPPTPCIFFLSLADYFAARHRAVPLCMMFLLYQTRFVFPIKSHVLGFIVLKSNKPHWVFLNGVMLKYPSTSVAPFCCSFPILCLLKWKINRALDILLRHHKLHTASFYAW